MAGSLNLSDIRKHCTIVLYGTQLKLENDKAYAALHGGRDHRVFAGDLADKGRRPETVRGIRTSWSRGMP